MATITVDTFLDDGTARTAGEIMTINGGIFTIRTDTRWHVGAPASMTGSLGNLTVNATLGGGVMIDARAVRWLPYNTGSGNMPAIGTTVTQSGTSGYLLGVYANLTSAPVAVGAAIPASGFIKFREVTGAYSAGALTGITATATGPDVTGWIEVVMREVSAVGAGRLGFFRTRGDWFYLGTTNGSAGQTFQVPTNGGGANTHVPGVWVETAPGSNEYEIYPGLGIQFNNTNLSTDIRCKYVQSVGGGVVRFGNDGTNNCGFVPPAGCKVRVPNIFMRASVVANDALNVAPNVGLATRPDFAVTGQAVVDMEYCLTDWYFSLTSAYSTNLKNVATFDSVQCPNQVAPFYIDNLCVGGFINANAVGLNLASSVNGGILTNSSLVKVEPTNNDIISIQLANNVTIDNVKTALIPYTRSTAPVSIRLSYVNNFELSNCVFLGGTLIVAWADKFTIKNIDYSDRLIGSTNLTTVLSAVSLSRSVNGLVDGLTCGFNNTIADVNPAGYFVSTDSSNIKIRNIGQLNNPVAISATTNAPLHTISTSGTNSGHEIKRIYVENVRTGLYLNTNLFSDVVVENLRSNTGLPSLFTNNLLLKGIRMGSAPLTTGNTGVVGTHGFDAFISDTVGYIWFVMNEPSTQTMDRVQTNLSPTSGFTATSIVSLKAVDNFISVDLGYHALGHTGFTQDMFYITSANPQNHKFECQLDTGSGFSAWQRLATVSRKNAGNLATGSTSFVLQDSVADIQIGDYVSGEIDTYFTVGTTVTNIVGSTITISDPTLAIVGANVALYFIPAAVADVSVDPSTGLRIKVRATVTIADNNNTITNIRLKTKSTLSAQTDNLYPLYNLKYRFTGLATGTEVAMFNSDDEELGRYIADGSGVANISLPTEDEYPDSYALIWHEDYDPILIEDIDFVDQIQIPSMNITQTLDKVFDPDSENKSTFDGALKLQMINDGTTDVSIQELYSDWKKWIRQTNNAQYDFAYTQLGGVQITESTEVPYYIFIQNDWKIRPQDANHTLTVTGGVLVAENDEDPFVNVEGAFTVRIVYQQPVQAIMTSGTSGSEFPPEVLDKLNAILRNTNLIPTIL